MQKHQWPLYLSAFFLCSSYVLLSDYSFIGKKTYVEGEFRACGKAEFDTRSVKDTKMRYADAFGALYYSHFLNKDNALSWEIGTSYLKFDWPKNPRFKKANYDILVGSLAWISTSIERWRWILAGYATVDSSSLNFGKTGVYYLLAWGNYFSSENVGLHSGLYAHYGMENLYVLPVIGADVRFWKKWKLNAIFPIDLSLTYSFNPNWSWSLKYVTFGRPYRHPWRVKGGVGRYKHGIFEVYASGPELDLNYKRNQKTDFFAGVGGGVNLGGWILIKDRHNHHPKYFKYDAAPFAKAHLTWGF